jgi:hypothetical protein
MKSALILCALAAGVNAAQPILVRVTPETLARLREKDPMIRLVDANGEDVEIQSRIVPSVVGQSTILHDGKHWTLVPNGSVVHIPAKLKSKVHSKPVGTLLPWQDFLARNKTWLTAAEVTFDQAAGNEPLPGSSLDEWKRSGKLVVTVHHMGPISIQTVSSGATTAKR